MCLCSGIAFLCGSFVNLLVGLSPFISLRLFPTSLWLFLDLFVG